jgi:RimJ/RimL family protein N-acetyltransferase
MNYWQSERVRLRAIEPEDAVHFLHWNEESERGRLLDFLWPPSSAHAVGRWAEEQSRQGFEGETFHWVIENRDGEAVGSISTHDCNPRNGTFSYGVDIAPEHRGQGYAGEAIRLVLAYYFNELRYQKVTVPIHGDNPHSIRLHQRLGFQEEGRLRRMIYTQGGFVDLLWYGLTKEEFGGMGDGLRGA